MARGRVTQLADTFEVPVPDDMVADIARQLDDAGEYRLTLVPDLPQRMVDLRWAALRAGRILGRPVEVAVSAGALNAAQGPVTIRLTSPAPTRTGIPRQRDAD